MGEEFDPTGLIVKLHYKDNSFKEIKDYTLSGFDSSEAGEGKIVTVLYRTVSTFFTVKIVDNHVHGTATSWVKTETTHKEVYDCCGAVKSPEEAHVYSKDYESNNNATTEADGTKSRVCDICGYVDTVTDEGTKLCSHNFVASETLIGVKVCSKCNELVPSPEGFVKIDAGEFTIGNSNSVNQNCKISKTINLTYDYYICDHEVTQSEYASVMGATSFYFSSNPATGEIQGNRPAERVSWYEALVYCNKLSIMEGLTPCYKFNDSTDPDEWGNIPDTNDLDWDNIKCDFTVNGYRLPTEFEWEKAARAGNNSSTDRLFSGTSDGTEVQKYAWVKENSSDKTHEVKKKSPNAFNLYDMTGNVKEWTWNEWTYNHQSVETTNPYGTDTVEQSLHTVKDGAYDDRSETDEYLCVYYRITKDSAIRDETLGFRVVKTAVSQE